MTLRDEYQARHMQMLVPLSMKLEAFIKEHFAGQPRIDRITVRAKSVDRFVEKAGKKDDLGKQRYDDPLNQIQDQIGARIVTFYKSDVERLKGIALKYLRPVENRAVVPDSPSQFGYEGHHFIMLIPEDILEENARSRGAPLFFELQIKTLFQHAWAEGEHDLAYKPPAPITHDQRRRFAFCAAQAWGADQIFEELVEEIGVSR